VAGAVRNLQYLNGVYFARVGVPKQLRAAVGKSELRANLGKDRKAAQHRLHVEVAKFLDILADARRRVSQDVRAPMRVLTAVELAHLHYDELLLTDDRLRDLSRDSGVSVAGWNRWFADGQRAALKRIAAGEACDDEIAAVVGVSLDVFQARGHIAAPRGSEQWRKYARLIASVEIEARTRSVERDTGFYAGTPQYPPLTQPRPADLHVEAVSLRTLLADHMAELQRSNRGAEAARRWRPCIDNLIEFLKHDDAVRLTRHDVIGWKEQLQTTLSPKTVRDSHMAALRAILRRGVDSGRLKENVADQVRVRVPAKQQTRERGLTDDEAGAILRAARAHQRVERKNARTTESVFTAAAKRWVPWLCAFTGARVAELTQLRKVDVRLDEQIPFIRITPEAGSVKTGQYRDVPLHPQLLDLGFGDFASSAADGPLFFDAGADRKGQQHPSKQVAQRLAVWIRSLKVVADEVDPNHGWRHRMKTVARDLDLNMRIIDAIQGHAPRTAGEHYGDVSLAAKNKVVKQLPRYAVND
jgi:integrase